MLSAEQRLARRSALGSSDAAAVVGVDPFRTRWEVWAEKVLDLEPDRASEQEAVEIGDDFEAPLLRWAARELGLEIETGVAVRAADGSPLAANLDARAIGRRVGLEAKTSSIADEWGEEGTDQIPERVIVQAHHQMVVADLELVWVPALLARRGRLHRGLYRVERNERLARFLRDRLLAFWGDHVVPAIAPPLQEAPPLELLARIRRVPESVVRVDPEIVNAWDAARQERLDAEKTEKKAEALLLLAIGNAESGDYGDPFRLFTYLPQSTRNVDSKALRRSRPEVYAEFERSSTYRVPRISKRRPHTISLP